MRNPWGLCERCFSRFARIKTVWDGYGHPEWNEKLCLNCYRKLIREQRRNRWVVPDVQSLY